MKKRLKFKAPRVVDMDESVAPSDLVSKFNQSFDELNEILVDRTNEVEALKICILSKNHLMLDGLHGTSKSKFAKEAFRRIEGAVVFRKQFMKGTQTDEIFGPMISERYRKDAVWEHNTTGMLPKAHFAYLDEIYRASDLLLPSMMGILNEREFHNGGVVQHCPLITAIGTTNFISTEEELDAFRDRFLITAKVMPLSTGASRLRMIESFLQKNKKTPTTVSLVELAQLHALVSRVKFTKESLEMYEQLVNKYKRSLGKSVYISDRRFCETIKLVQAFHTIEKEGDETALLEPESLVAASYGLCRLNEASETDAFNQVFQGLVGTYTIEKQEEEQFRPLLVTLNQIYAEGLERSTKEPRLRVLYKKTKTILDVVDNTPADALPKTTRGLEIFEEIRRVAGEAVNHFVTKLGTQV
jgi:MoxR-like ATPase